MEDYTIEQLEKTFMEHHESAIKTNKERIENFKKNFPDSEMPPSYLNDFSISIALHVICREINQIKNKDMIKRKEEMFPRSNNLPIY